LNTEGKTPEVELVLDSATRSAIRRELVDAGFADPDSLSPISQKRSREQHQVVARSRDGAVAGFALLERCQETGAGLVSFSGTELGKCERELVNHSLDSVHEGGVPDSALRAVFAVDLRGEEADVEAMKRLGAAEVSSTVLRGAFPPEQQMRVFTLPLDGKPTVENDDLAAVVRFLGGDLCRTDPTNTRTTVDLVPLSRGLEFERFGVVLHFAVMEAEEPGEAEPGLSAVLPNVEEPGPFASFEEDILSYRSRSARENDSRHWVRSETVTVKSEAISLGEGGTLMLAVPVPITFWSEGRKRDLYFPPPVENGFRLRRVAVKASRTRFPSGHSICHLAIVQAEPGDRLDEYDVIALSKLWQGGENWLSAADKIRVHSDPSADGEKGVPIGRFAEEVFARTPIEPKVRGGTVQLICQSPDDVDWKGIWDAVKQFAADEDPEDELVTETPFGKRVTPLGKQVTALAGIVQGILDFQAVDIAELKDVFAGHVNTEECFTGIHKGTLLCVMDSDRAYEAVASTIGVSPYLLLPQAVLLHNEVLLEKVEEEAENVESEGGRRPGGLENVLERLAHYIPDVFHYAQEHSLYECGEKTRGLADRRTEMGPKVARIEAQRKSFVESRRTWAETVRNILLGLIGFVSTLHYVHGSTSRIAVFFAFAVVLTILHTHPWWPDRLRFWSRPSGRSAPRRRL